MINYEDIKKANEEIITTSIKGNEYAEVNQRITAFKKVFPQGFIITEMESNINGVCVFKANVGYYKDNEALVLGTGHAYEKEGSSFINKTSYIENCETSAVGRALGMAGFGIDKSVASAEEVKNAINNQPTSKANQKVIVKMAEKFGKKIEDICKAYKIQSIEEMTSAQFADCIEQFRKIEEKDK